jgi:hypothetical protein
MTAIFVLDVDEFRPVIEAAGRRQPVESRRFGPYIELSADGPIEIDRRESGVRHAVWYSALAGVRAGRVVQFDKDALKVVPE